MLGGPGEAELSTESLLSQKGHPEQSGFSSILPATRLLRETPSLRDSPPREGTGRTCRHLPAHRATSIRVFSENIPVFQNQRARLTSPVTLVCPAPYQFPAYFYEPLNLHGLLFSINGAAHSRMASNDNTSCLDGGQPTDTIINKNSSVSRPLTRAQGGAGRLPAGWRGRSSPCSRPHTQGPGEPVQWGREAGGQAFLEGAHWGPGKALTLSPARPFLRGLWLPPGQGTPRWPVGASTLDSEGSAPPLVPGARSGLGDTADPGPEPLGAQAERKAIPPGTRTLKLARVQNAAQPRKQRRVI